MVDESVLLKQVREATNNSLIMSMIHYITGVKLSTYCKFPNINKVTD